MDLYEILNELWEKQDWDHIALTMKKWELLFARAWWWGE